MNNYQSVFPFFKCTKEDIKFLINAIAITYDKEKDTYWFKVRKEYFEETPFYQDRAYLTERIKKTIEIIKEESAVILTLIEQDLEKLQETSDKRKLEIDQFNQMTKKERKVFLEAHDLFDLECLNFNMPEKMSVNIAVFYQFILKHLHIWNFRPLEDKCVQIIFNTNKLPIIYIMLT